MDDRGDKIINLAREMLRSDVVVDFPERGEKPVISFKVLCFATVLAALGSSALTEATGEAHRPINRYEKTELKALVFYAARLKGFNEDELRHEVEQKLGTSIDEMTAGDFREARDFLQRKAQ